MRTLLLLLSMVSVLVLPTGAAARKGHGGGGGAACPADVGLAVATACPCDGSASSGPWRNHGKYVSCVAHARNMLRRQGCLTDAARTLQRCAARSTCGKTGAVLCCVTTPGTCTGDPMPADGTAAGTCVADATRACDTNADCAVTKGPTLASSADACVAAGGTPSGPGSVCASCPAP